MLLVAVPAFAQSPKYKSDSIQISQMLEKEQKLVDSADLDKALLFCDSAFAQYALLPNTPYKKGLAQIHLAYSDVFYRKSDYRQMVGHDSAALQIGQSLKDTNIIAIAYNQLGLYFAEEGAQTKAERLFKMALSIKFEKEQSSSTAEVYNNLGYLFGGLDKEKGIDWDLKALRLYEKLGDESGQAQVNSNIGSLLYSLGRNAEAFPYFKRCIALREKINDQYGLAIAYSNMAQLYVAMDSANAALRYQQLGMERAEKTGSTKLIAQAYTGLSLLYYGQKDYKKALDLELKTVHLLEDAHDEEMLSRRYIAAGTLSSLVLDSTTAIDYLNKAIALSKKLNNRDNLRDAYLHTTIFFKEHKDFYNAYENFKNYVRIKDSIINDATIARVAELQTQYETEKKDAEIKQLSSQQLIQKLEIEKQQAIIKGNLLEAKEKQNQIDLLTQTQQVQDLKIKQQDQALEKQTLLARNLEQQRKLAVQDKLLKEKQLQNQTLLRNFIIGLFVFTVVIGGMLFSRFRLKKRLEQQQLLLRERSRISSELHDEVGSALSAINILSHSAKAKFDSDQNKSKQLLGKISENAQQMMDAMSDIVWSINPANDTLGSILVRMKEFAAEVLEARNINYRFDVGQEITALKLTPEKRRDFYLIYKEAINNLAKYAEATKASIHLSVKDNQLQMTITDNGKGFDLTNGKTGNGLGNMRNRALQQGGRLDIESAVGKGTTITLTLPLAS